MKKVTLTDEEYEALKTFFDDLCQPEGIEGFFKEYVEAYKDIEDRSLIMNALKKLGILP